MRVITLGVYVFLFFFLFCFVFFFFCFVIFRIFFLSATPLIVFFLFSLQKEKGGGAQSYNLEERKGSLETLKEIAKLYQTSNEPVTCLLAG